MSYPEKFHGIFARNCEIRRIDRQTAADFLAVNHIYGDCTAKFRYGIFVSRYSGAENTSDAPHPYPVGTMVAAATFSGGRKWIKNGKEIRSYEWLRYASLPSVRVLGGMGKVLETFIAEAHPDDIMSYAPAEHFDGSVYETLGFIREGSKTFRKETPEGTVESTSWKFRLKLTDYC